MKKIAIEIGVKYLQKNCNQRDTILVPMGVIQRHLLNFKVRIQSKENSFNLKVSAAVFYFDQTITREKAARCILFIINRHELFRVTMSYVLSQQIVHFFNEFLEFFI